MDTAAKITADYISDVLTYFLFTTPAGIAICIFIAILVAFKLWNWGIRDRTRQYIKHICNKQLITIYDKQEETLNEIKYQNIQRNTPQNQQYQQYQQYQQMPPQHQQYK
ncbi:hypothetical protein ACTQ3J_09830 [Oscillospiraceae bacterium LCP25S3_E3]